MFELPPSAITTWGGAIVFLNVLLTRLGVPIPAVPILLFAGSAIAAGTLSFWPTLCAAVLGALLGDAAWFTAGRIYGRKLMAALGRIAPAADARLDTARSMFERFGVPLVAISKFVPGLGLITPPLMGTTAVDIRIYAAWDVAGAVAWATFWLLGGAAAERELHMLLAFVRARGGTVVDVLLAVALLYLAYRLYQRRRARLHPTGAATETREATTDATVDTAASRGWRGRRGWRQRRAAMLPRVLDARPQALANGARSGIPGALPLDPHSPEQVNGALHAYDMVIYCICPDSATAVDITQCMRRNGYTRIRALRGGLDAWQRRGFPVTSLSPVDEMIAGQPSWASAGDARGAVTLRGLAPKRA
ncbi:membrane protein DedA with SNARE-associated domain/rhodanese-related sulfurtransferase [Paraburkholderia sp. GAS199]|uniref:VTT domain-containing protein n=1 Tax=Paraburkholderia sp. GAS199 TaxID=3035126 RepID=UPI003D253278